MGLFSGGLAGIGEKIMGGENLGKKLKQLDKYAIEVGNRGRGFTDEGISGLRDLDRRFNDQIAEGGLTDSVERSFDVAEGRLSDQFVRGGRALRSALEQQRRAGGGFLTPEAIAAMTAEADQSRNEEYFDSSNELGFAKANLQQQSTQELYDRILAIRDSIRQTGLSQEEMAAMMRLQVAGLRHNRMGAIDNSMRSWFSMIGGGAMRG